MKYLIVFLGVLLLPAVAQAKVHVFACEPEWGALAEEIGRDLVEVHVATTAHQDVHHIRAKPSLLAAMRKAELVFCSGAALESGWLPILLKKAGGPDVQPETQGWLMASDYVEKLEVMEHADRSMGHVHPEGNPHVHLDPHHVALIAEALYERLYFLDPDHAEAYRAQLESFKTRWQALTAQWDAKAAPLKGRKVVVYHNVWAYLLEWLGMDVAVSLEPKPGIPPSASHLETVLKEVQGQDILAILVAPYENDTAAVWLAERTGLPVLKLPYTIGGSERAQDLPSLYDETIALLVEAAHEF